MDKTATIQRQIEILVAINKSLFSQKKLTAEIVNGIRKNAETITYLCDFIEEEK